MSMRTLKAEGTPAYNSTYKKLAVLWLNEAVCFVSSSVLVDSFVLRNRQLLVAAKRYKPAFFVSEYFSLFLYSTTKRHYFDFNLSGFFVVLSV
jgi:hypothetical protein